MSENGTNELLSEEEKHAVRESWTVIWNDKKTNGIKILVKLFKLYPDAISRFKDFNGLTLEEVKVHKKLVVHALSVIYALKSFIDNLDDVETLVQLVQKNASNHVERNVTEKQIMWLKPIFIDILEEIMGDEMTDIHRTAWNKLFNAIKSFWKQKQDSVVALQTEASQMSENGTNELLSEEEETAVKESWTVIWNDKKTNGIKIFVKLFTLYPDAINRFKDFNGLTLEEVKVHKKLRAHALSVIYALKSFIDNLDDVETLVELVKKNASNHVERNVTEKQIMWLKPIFIDILEEIMGDEMTDIHRNAWNKLFNAIKSLWKQEQDSVVAQQTEAS